MTLVLGDKLTGEPTPENLEVGEIFVRKIEQRRTENGNEYTKRFIEVGDISDNNPLERKKLNDEFDVQNDYLKGLAEAGVLKLPTKQDDGTWINTNIVFNSFYDRGTGEATSMQHWGDVLMPTALALFPLQRPDDAGRLFPNEANDAKSNRIYRYARDSIGIRSRAVILRESELELAANSDKNVFKVLALGAGAGVPDIDATVATYKQLGKAMHVDMIDFNTTSLEFAATLAREAGIPVNDETPSIKGHIQTKRGDYRKPFKGESEQYDVVEILGLWEYLDEDRCIESVEESYRLLAPGGKLVVSNMRTDRKQLDFNVYGIAWPGVVPRDETQIVDFVAAAKINTEDVTLTVTGDGVYSVMEIRKP